MYNYPFFVTTAVCFYAALTYAIIVLFKFLGCLGTLINSSVLPIDSSPSLFFPQQYTKLSYLIFICYNYSLLSNNCELSI